MKKERFLKWLDNAMYLTTVISLGVLAVCVVLIVILKLMGK